MLRAKGLVEPLRGSVTLYAMSKNKKTSKRQTDRYIYLKQSCALSYLQTLFLHNIFRKHGYSEFCGEIVPKMFRKSHNHRTQPANDTKRENKQTMTGSLRSTNQRKPFIKQQICSICLSIFCTANICQNLPNAKVILIFPYYEQKFSEYVIRSQLAFYINPFPASILHQSIAGHYRPVRVADGPITARYRFI